MLLLVIEYDLQIILYKYSDLKLSDRLSRHCGQFLNAIDLASNNFYSGHLILLQVTPKQSCDRNKTCSHSWTKKVTSSSKNSLRKNPVVRIDRIYP